MDVAGQDATEAFEDIGHSDEAREILDGLLVGPLKRAVSLAAQASPISPPESVLIEESFRRATQSPPALLPTHPPSRAKPTRPVSASASTPSSSSAASLATPATNTCRPNKDSSKMLARTPDSAIAVA